MKLSNQSVFILLASFLVGSSITGLMAFFNMDMAVNQLFSDYKILIPPVLVGGLLGTAISYFVTKSQQLHSDQLEAEKRIALNFENELKQNKEMIRVLFADASVGICFNSLDGKILEVNNAYCKMLGYTGDELLTKTIADITVPGDHETTESRRQNLFKQEKATVSREKRYLRKDGSTIWCYLTGTLIRDLNGTPLHFVAIVQDISARKKAEEILKESEQRFAKIFQSNPVMQSITRLSDGVMIDVNDSWLDTLGFTKEEAVGKSAADLNLVVDFTKEKRDSIIEHIRSSKKPDHFNGKMKCRDGNIREFDVSADIVEIGGEEHLLLASADVTDQKLKEEQLNHSLKMEAVGQLTGGLAHDFNNLLAAALGNIELLQSPDIDPSQVEERLESTRKSILSGADLTKRLLAFSRKQQLDPEIVNASELVNSTFELLRRTLSRNINIELKTPSNLWPIFIDKNQLENALINLALNSRDAMIAGGVLTIECANSDIDPETADAKLGLEPGEYITISVTDTGMGIQQSILDKVIEPFFTTKGVGEGSGLGLSMIYGFVKQSGGYFEIQSEPNVGTTVTMYIPRDTEIRADSTGDSTDVVMPTGNGERVLVIEDEPEVREITMVLLEILGYAPADGGDGSKISDILKKKEFNYDLIISDVVLSNEISGPELADEILQRKKDTKILLMTGYAEEDVITTMDGVLKFPVINKPFTKDELAKKVHELLQDSV